MSIRNRIIIVLFFCFLLTNKVEAQQSDTIKGNHADSLANDSIWRSLLLHEVLVKGSNVKHHPNKDVWTITSDMRKNTVNTYELLEKIPGLFVNRIDKKINFRGKNDVLIIVDGKEKDSEYIGNLANLRFKKVEIYDNTYSRFPNKVVINLITKEDWQGYDFVTEASTLMLPSTPYGKFFSRANASSSFTYTRPQYDFATGFRYNHTNNSLAESRELQQGKLYHYHLLEDGPNMTLYVNAFTGWLDYDFRLTKGHVISAKYAYSRKSQDIHNHYLYDKRDLLLHSTTSLSREIQRDNDYNQHALNFYYRGDLNSWKLYSEIGFNFYNDHTLYSLCENTGFDTKNLYHNKRNVWTMNVDATKKFKNGNTLNISLSHASRYYSGIDQISGLVETNNYKEHRLALDYQFVLSKNLSGFITGAYSNIHVTAYENNFYQNVFSGDALLNYVSPDKKTNAEIRFYSNLYPPTYSQVLPFTNVIDSMTFITGNPLLKTEVSYGSSAMFLRWPFYTSFDIQYSGNKSSMEYEWTDGKIKGQYQNVNYTAWVWSIGIEPNNIEWGRHSLNFKAHVEYHNRHIWHHSNKQTQTGWRAFADITYSIDKIASFKLEYVSWPRYDIFTQGKERFFNDWWHLSIWKYLMGKRLFIGIDYNLPIRFGISTSSLYEISTPFYSDYHNTGYYEKNRNSINLTVRYQLFKGHEVVKQNNRQNSKVIRDEFDQSSHINN